MRSEVQDALEAYVQEGALRMLALALEEEVNAFLGRRRYAEARSFGATATDTTRPGR